VSQFVPLESLVAFSSTAVLEDPRPVLDRLKALELKRPESAELALPTLGKGEQYRFHFDMTRCIGCRCCEVACNEQNNNPAHVKWRRVGEIEGGSYPQVHRLHLSMSCNHCLEPSCLEGCPVDAYTKLENGIVTHDAKACIGCQYCTWNCPYGVPQYHPERHVVTKCHLCVDRIAGGELPACVQACPTSAIQIEKVNIAQWRDAIAEGNAPGVPPADLTFSTTRITIPEGLPDTMGKTGAWRLEPEAPHWPLVFFLVLSQWSVGLFAVALLFHLVERLCLPVSGHLDLQMVWVTTLAAFGVGQLSLSASIFHLGRPIHAFRAVKAWRRSWLSREVLAFLCFILLGLAPAAISALGLFPGVDLDLGSRWYEVLLSFTLAAGALGVISSAGIYRIPARPAWDTWRTPAQFFLTIFSLGAAGGLLVISIDPSSDPGQSPETALRLFLGTACALSALLQASIPWTILASGLSLEDSPLRGMALLLTRRFPRLLWLRTLLLGALALLSLASVLQGRGPSSIYLAGGGLASGLLAEGIGRYLFFVTVVPRNTPGHFFGRNS
jgi:DMSO reductase iron-sulfur subunit